MNIYLRFKKVAFFLFKYQVRYAIEVFLLHDSGP